MYSLLLECEAADVDQISFALWQAGTAGIREETRLDSISGAHVLLIAAFEDHVERPALSAQFAAYRPSWKQEEDIDWVGVTHDAWPGRCVGERLFLAPMWNSEATPAGRLRVIHNPGLASGTGEHPCTQLALESLESLVIKGCRLIDIGAGSGILMAAALQLGAGSAIGFDTDMDSLATARENLNLNHQPTLLVAGSADCAADGVGDIVAANISGTVLLSLADDLLRIVRTGGALLLTGFPESELKILQQAFGAGIVSGINEWRCLAIKS